MPIQFMYSVVIITTEQDKANAMELWKQATKLGSSEAQEWTKLICSQHESQLQTRKIKDRIRTGKACSNVSNTMDLASVTSDDIDALPWDDEDMTVKRCKWCDEFETDTHKMLKCIAC